MKINRADVMMGYVENYYRESLFYTAQNNAKGEELDIIHTIIEDMPNQFNPQTATWGLRLWEEMLGIDGSVENIEERRSCIMIKLLTQQRFTPISLERLIKNTVGANVDILRNIAPYTFEVRVKDDSLDYDNALIWKIIEEYKEAHMTYRKAFQVKIVLNINHLNSIIFTTAFYPQFNLPELLLNGSWKLDGSKILNGYDGSEHIDLHPVEIELQDKVKNVLKEKLGVCFLIETRRKIVSSQEITIQTEAYPRFNLPEFSGGRINLYPVEIEVRTKAEEVIQEKPKIIFLTETREKITNKPEIKVQVSTIHHGTAKEKITIQTEAEVKTGTGEIFMDNQNFLDGSWELDGSRALNGGDYQW